MKKGDKVLSRASLVSTVFEGEVRGGGRPCRQIEGCRGQVFPVRWQDGKLTWCCTKGVSKTEKGWQIQ